MTEHGNIGPFPGWPDDIERDWDAALRAWDSDDGKNAMATTRKGEDLAAAGRVLITALREQLALEQEQAAKGEQA